MKYSEDRKERSGDCVKIEERRKSRGSVEKYLCVERGEWDKETCCLQTTRDSYTPATLRTSREILSRVCLGRSLTLESRGTRIRVILY
ncbi:hypothetical protein ALC62_08533 [Cyphomyrmex costatus]|uniref:Uncharacterized protein n=1 Tax=Cyphomyrmex costatus TaxID=456900 RepID=A0A151IGW3_9HYME|nr:hypothetical protein ALC62_08533 [Cyphomyrmex costatus]